MFYDRPKTPVLEDAPKVDDTAEEVTVDDLNLGNYPRWLRQQVREMVLRYFLRIATFTDAEFFPDAEANLPSWLVPLSWIPRAGRRRAQGLWFSQRYYRDAATGRVGKFPESEQRTIVDLREIGKTYSWIVLKVDLHDFALEARPFGPRGPKVTLPMDKGAHLVVSPELVVDEEPLRNRRSRPLRARLRVPA